MSDNRPVVANLDFASIKQDMIDYFKSKPEFKDYEFTGSSLNLLMDILAYNTHYNSLAANFLVNEMFLDSALMRNNVVSIAKQLNYQPRSARAARATMRLKVPQRDTSVNYYIVPAGSLFTATQGNSTINFYTTRDYTVQYGTADSDTIAIEVSEGTLITQRFVQGNNSTNFPAFDLLDANIDTTSIVTAVNGVRYDVVSPQTEGISNLNKDSLIYFVEETREQTHRLVFGNNVIGKGLNTGDEIISTYIITNGPAGNGVKLFSPVIPGRPDISIVPGTVTTAQGGAAIESIREIKDQAPHWYQAQYRAVTENDYAAIIRSRFADIQSINVYGGEKVNKPGQVFISIKPKSGDKLTDATKNSLTSEVLSTSNVVTVRPTIIDPFIIKLVLKTTATYDPAKSLSSADVLKAKIISLFNTFNTQYIGSFLTNFRESQLSTQIAALDSSIVSSNTRVRLRVEIEAKNQSLSLTEWSFNNKIYHPEVGFKASTGGVLSTNLFSRVGKTFKSGFDDDGNGNIRLYDFIDNTRVYIDNSAGTINYLTGEITIKNFDPVDGKINFTVIADSVDVIAENNNILQIAIEDSVIDVIDKNNTTLQRTNNNTRSF